MSPSVVLLPLVLLLLPLPPLLLLVLVMVIALRLFAATADAEVTVSFPAIVSGIENNAAGIDTGCRANAAIHNYFLFVFYDDAFAGFLLDLHIHATIDDAIVIDSLHYFVHVASVVDVIVIVLSQTIRLIRPTFLYRVDGVADAEQFRVGAQRRFVCRYDAGFN
ncbi:AAEL000969-PA [Aedes aegypti]|uniref:AAEL000969-PA n=1 Tax=Aedes aegypti TaxID=7159 RepID=Q17MR2_AEDAE|nr:AAEL000969-PA [Aedes aegypti]